LMAVVGNNHRRISTILMGVRVMFSLFMGIQNV
jgi:hypothetical protein